jgi:hypothetical protein
VRGEVDVGGELLGCERCGELVVAVVRAVRQIPVASVLAAHCRVLVAGVPVVAHENVVVSSGTVLSSATVEVLTAHVTCGGYCHH